MKITVILVNIIMTILIFPVIVLYIMMGVGMIQHPNLLEKIVDFFFIALPIVIIVTQIISWIAFSKQNYAFALKINALPVLNFLIIIILFLFLYKFIKII